MYSWNTLEVKRYSDMPKNCVQRVNTILKGDVMKLFFLVVSMLNVLFAYEYINPVGNAQNIFDIASDGSSYVAVGGSGKILYASSASSEYVPIKDLNTSSDFQAIVYGDGKYIAVANKYVNGHSVTFYSSSDGQHWSAGNAYENSYIAKVIYNGSKYVAVGSLAGGTGDSNEATLIMTSSDGISWDAKTITSNKYMRDIIYVGNKFVAVGDYYDTTNSAYQSAVITSSDAVTWNIEKDDFNASISDIHYANGKFVLVGYQQVGYQKVSKIYESSDGSSWSDVAFSFATNVSGVGFKDITYFNGLYYVSGGDPYNLYTSSDLSVWTKNSAISGLSGTITNFFDVNGEFYLALGNGLYTTTDGTTFTNKLAITSSSLDNIAELNGALYIFYNEYDANYQQITYMLTSTDGGNSWTRSNTGLGIYVSSVIKSGDKIYIFDGQKSIASTSDALTWTTNTIDSQVTQSSDFVIGNGTFFVKARKYDTTTYSYKYYSYVSNDGVTWEATPLPDGFDYIKIFFDGSKFIAPKVSSDTTTITLYTSTDAKTWSEGDVITRNFTTSYAGTTIDFLVNDMNTTVGLGSFATSIIYEDGCWKNYSLSAYTYTNRHFTKYVKYKDGFIVADSYGALYYTSDFKNWSVISSVDFGGGTVSISQMYASGDSIIVVGANGVILKLFDSDLTTKVATTTFEGTCLSDASTTVSTQELNLSASWNLLALPVDINVSASDLDAKFPHSNLVWKYKDGWEVYGISSAMKSLISQSSLKTIDSIEAGEGFWIDSSTQESISFEGGSYSFTDTNFSSTLGSSWNLVGTGSDMNVTSLTCSNDLTLGTVWKFSNGSWYLYSANAPADNYGFNNLESINANDGFWVLCK